METGNHLEPGEGWGGEPGGEDWVRLQSVLELVRREHQRTELSEERRAELRDRVLARVERYETRRRRWRGFVKAAGALLVAWALLKVIERARAMS